MILLLPSSVYYKGIKNALEDCRLRDTPQKSQHKAALTDTIAGHLDAIVMSETSGDSSEHLATDNVGHDGQEQVYNTETTGLKTEEDPVENTEVQDSQKTEPGQGDEQQLITEDMVPIQTPSVSPHLQSDQNTQESNDIENLQHPTENEVYNEGMELNPNGKEEQENSATVPSTDVEVTREHVGDVYLEKGDEIQAEIFENEPSEIYNQKGSLERSVKDLDSSAEEKMQEAVSEDIAKLADVEEKAMAIQIAMGTNENVYQEESLVSTATPWTLFEKENLPSTDKPINMSWSFGINKNIPAFNLHDEDHQMIVYASAHTAVIHDFLLNRQRHLQGHCSCISCMCVSDDRRWIATGDRGPESLIIIWDSFSGIPVHTIFNSHPGGGVIAVTISKNAKYLATVGGEIVQRVSIWDWTTGAGEPVCTVELNAEFALQKYITFNPQDHTQLITNSEKQVIFYSWNDSNLDYIAPPLNNKTFNKVVGDFSQSVFDFGSIRALTGTSAGKLAVWETIFPKSSKAKSTIRPHNKKALKLMHVQKDGITVLTTHDRYFITGDVRGHVKFYDQQLQLVNWYSHFNLAPIRSISFSKCEPVVASEKTKYPQDCSIRGDQFSISNFIVSTSDSLVLHVFTDGTLLKKVLQEPHEAVHALTSHPYKPHIATGSYNGVLKVWDYKDRNHFISRVFGKGKQLNCLSYDPKGFIMAAGFTDGSVHILDAMTLEDETKEPFKYARGSITHIQFSHDSQYLASADEEFTVTLFKLISQKNGAVWEHFGRYRSHYKPIKSIIFTTHLDNNEPRLLSLGMDRMLVEYDLANSRQGYLQVMSTDRIDQSAVPQCLVWYPPVTKESFMMIANDQYKMKLFNATTKMCRRTILGPTFGSPIRKMEILSSHSHTNDQGFLAYITDDKVGLQILPIDGNPHKSFAVICHPDGVANMACSHDGRYLFTSGGDDCTVMMWETNLQALEAVASLGGNDLIPFYGLLQGGRDGLLFKELEDYFYYAQLRNQGIDTMETRQVSTHIPLKEVPFIMRALGFYPSEQEVEDMLNEVKFSEYVETGKQVTHINLGDFIKLYVNHRPAFGLSVEEIQNAFQELGFVNEKGEQTINRGVLLQLLQTRGEHMTEDELAEDLSTLLGLNPEGGSSELSNYDSTGASVILEQEIPEQITMDMFSSEILGLPFLTNEDFEEHIEIPETVSA
ncbi:cilia- and flagella-associated protein 251 [Pelodytes ibericus]